MHRFEEKIVIRLSHLRLNCGDAGCLVGILILLLSSVRGLRKCELRLVTDLLLNLIQLVLDLGELSLHHVQRALDLNHFFLEDA